MGDIIIDDEMDSRLPPALQVGLPDEVLEWANLNAALISRVQKALFSTYTHPTEEQVWEAIAASSGSATWRDAHDKWRTAEDAWRELNDPLNMPLGAIGQALESDATNAAKERSDLSLAHFAIINEELRQRPDLRNLLSVLLVQQRMLGQSTQSTQQTVKAVAALADLVCLSDEFHSASRPPSRLKRGLTAQARRFFMPQAPQAQPATSVIVPWLPKI